MKHTKLTLILAIAAVTALGHCQSAPPKPVPTHAVVYDFVTGLCYEEMSDGSLKKLDHFPSLKAGKPTILRIINLNTSRYQIQIDEKEESTYSTIPGQFRSLFSLLPVRDLSNIADLKSLSGFGTNRDTANVLPPKAGAGLDMRIGELTDGVESLQNAIDASDQVDQIQAKLLAEARKLPNPTRDQVYASSDPLEPSRKAMADLRVRVKGVVDSALGGAQAKSGVSGKSMDVLGDLLHQEIRSRRERVAQLANDLDEETNNFDGVVADSLATASRDIADANRIPTLVDVTKKILKVRRAADKAVNNADRRAELIDNSMDQRSRANHQAQQLYDRIMNENLFVTDDHPFTPRLDVVHYTILVVPTKDPGDSADAPDDAVVVNLPAGGKQGAKPASDNVVIHLDTKVVGRTKVDYSTGVMLTNLTDDNYYLEKTSPTTKIVHAGISDKLTYRLAGLAHLYRTGDEAILPALSFGVGVPVNGKDPQVMLGASLILNNAQRFILTFGVCAGGVDRLNNGAKVGKPWDGTLSSLTHKVMRAGYFMGLTFNLD